MTEWYGGKWGDDVCSLAKFAVCEMRVSHLTYCQQACSDWRSIPRCLLNHEIKKVTTTGVIGCGQACWAEPRCHSFNLWQWFEKGKICQLNSASSLEADVADFKYVENCYFYEL